MFEPLILFVPSNTDVDYLRGLNQGLSIEEINDNDIKIGKKLKINYTW